MLRFQTHPDKVFTIILHDSMSLMLARLRDLDEYSKHIGTRQDNFENLLPNAYRVFNAETALTVLNKMLLCQKEAWRYILNDYHYLLLYDTLQCFSEIHNDMVRTAQSLQEREEASMIGGVHIERINFNDLVAMFFFDNDFLLDTETVINLGLDKRKLLGIHGETFSISQGLAPHPEELALVKDYNNWNDPAEQPPLWSESSTAYPDMQATDQ